MRPLALLTPVLLAISACGPGSGTTTDTDSSPGTTSTGDPPATTGDTGTSTPTTTALTTATITDPGTTDTTTTDGPFPGTTTVGTTTSTTTGATTDADTTDTDAPDTSTGGDEGEYAAFYVPGGLDRIVVRKADFDADLCTSVVFVWPMQNIQPDLVVPQEWAYQDAEIAQGTADCLEFMGWLPDAVAALDIGGSADWPVPQPCPGTLDIDVTLLFPQDPPWVPAQNTLTASGLPLQGC